MAVKNKENEKQNFALPPENYKFIAIGFGIVVLGFLLMLGGKSPDPNIFIESGRDSMFSFRRITLAPIVVLAGFAFVMWAIMKKPKE
jgi:hypothetical protein